MQDGKTSRRNAAALILVLAAVTAYYAFAEQGAPSLRFSPQEHTFTLTGAKQTRAVFAVDALTTLELYEGGDYGLPVDGGQMPLGGVCYGAWESESLGRYEAFFSERTDIVILVGDGERTAAFNFENEDSTRALLGQMDALVRDAKGCKH